MLGAVTICMWTIAMVITVVYCGQLVATLSTNVARLPFKTLQEFADQDEIIPFVSKGISSHSMWLVNITLCDIKYITKSSCELLVNAFVTSHLD